MNVGKERSYTERHESVAFVLIFFTMNSIEEEGVEQKESNLYIYLRETGSYYTTLSRSTITTRDNF